MVIFHSISEFLQTTCLDDGHSDTYLFLFSRLLPISEDKWSNPLIFNKVRNSNGRVLKMLNSFWDDGHLVILGDTPCPHPSNCLTYKQTNSATLFMGTDKWISYLYVKTLHLLLILVIAYHKRDDQDKMIPFLRKLKLFFQIPNVRADMKRLHFHNPPPPPNHDSPLSK